MCATPYSSIIGPRHSGEGYSIQDYAIQFVSDFQQVCGLLRVLRFPPPIKLTANPIGQRHGYMYKVQWSRMREFLKNTIELEKVAGFVSTVSTFLTHVSETLDTTVYLLCLRHRHNCIPLVSET